MNSWRIPAKTFLIGEYVAIHGGPALVLTTSPCFEVTLEPGQKDEGLLAGSPAEYWLSSHRLPNQALAWRDPYEGIGGLGASSAQFIGAYLASCRMLGVEPSYRVLLDAFYQSSWNGEGVRPSGYDVLAQTQNEVVYIHRNHGIMQANPWSFSDLGFVLLHSGQKLATHYHLQGLRMQDTLDDLIVLAEHVCDAFLKQEQSSFIEGVNHYQEMLFSRSFMAKHSAQQIEEFRRHPKVLAAKGCGAMGADVLLLIMAKNAVSDFSAECMATGWNVLATDADLYTQTPLLYCDPKKMLEILP